MARLESDIERNVYLGEVSRSTGVEEDAIRSEVRKLMRKEEAARRSETVRAPVSRQSGNGAKLSKRAEKGLLEAQRNLLFLCAQYQGVQEKLQDVLEAADFTEEAYRVMYTAIGQMWQENGHVFPADLVSRFEGAEEQKAAAEVFAVQLPQEDGAEIEKAVNEQVRLLKRTKIDQMTANAVSAEELQSLMEAKRKLESLYITI